MSFYLPLLTPYFERIAIGETLTSLWSAIDVEGGGDLEFDFDSLYVGVDYKF